MRGGRSSVHSVILHPLHNAHPSYPQQRPAFPPENAASSQSPTSSLLPLQTEFCNKKNKNADNRKEATNRSCFPGSTPSVRRRERPLKRGSCPFLYVVLFVTPGCQSSMSPLVVASPCRFDRIAGKRETIIIRPGSHLRGPAVLSRVSRMPVSLFDN